MIKGFEIVIDRFAKSRAGYLKVNFNDGEVLEIEKKTKKKKTTSSGNRVSTPELNAEYEIKATYVGRYQTKSLPKVGDVVDADAKLGTVFSIGVEHDIVNVHPRSVVKEVLVEENDIVEFGQVLFVLTKENDGE